jgi:hypothetical protein
VEGTMAEAVKWTKTVPMTGFVGIERLVDPVAGNSIRVTGWDASPIVAPGPSEVYVDVAFNIGGHTETYRVHATYGGTAVLAFKSVEELA